MKRYSALTASALVLISLNALAATPATDSLEDQLKALNIPENQAPAGVTGERLYAVQSRYSPLKFRSEFSFGGGRNLTADGFLVSDQVDLGYRFYLSDKWYLGLNGSAVFNSLSTSAERLRDEQALLPDIAWAKYRSDLMVGYNVFYGKFRLSMDQVFYFDQYIALGGGAVELQSGWKPSAVADIGFAFWLGRRGSIRIGLKDYLFNEQRRLSSGLTNQLIGHLDLGILFGG